MTNNPFDKALTFLLSPGGMVFGILIILEAIHMLPGYTHNIINLSQTEPLITLMWANEQFDPSRPDTFFEPVDNTEER